MAFCAKGGGINDFGGSRQSWLWGMDTIGTAQARWIMVLLAICQTGNLQVRNQWPIALAVSCATFFRMSTAHEIEVCDSDAFSC